jgi:hypothetical protein
VEPDRALAHSQIAIVKRSCVLVSNPGYYIYIYIIQVDAHGCYICTYMADMLVDPYILIMMMHACSYDSSSSSPLIGGPLLIIITMIIITMILNHDYNPPRLQGQVDHPPIGGPFLGIIVINIIIVIIMIMIIMITIIIIRNNSKE